MRNWCLAQLIVGATLLAVAGPSAKAGVVTQQSVTAQAAVQTASAAASFGHWKYRSWGCYDCGYGYSYVRPSLYGGCCGGSSVGVSYRSYSYAPYVYPGYARPAYYAPYAYYSRSYYTPTYSPGIGYGGAYYGAYTTWGAGPGSYRPFYTYPLGYSYYGYAAYPSYRFFAYPYSGMAFYPAPTVYGY